VHDFREYRDLESLHKSVEKVKQQLEVLQAFTVQKQAAAAAVMNLQLAGFSEKEIAELTALVGRWNMAWSRKSRFKSR